MQELSGAAIAVIPARGGSKRIPRKNVRLFGGKPMLAWPIEAALRSGLFGHVLVSTDDEEIADVARAYGAKVPFIRPADLADDYTGTGEVMAHATRWAQAQGWEFQAACCIYATAAFVQEADLVRGLAALRSGDWSYAIAATTFAAPVFRAFRQCEDGGLEMYFPQHVTTRSQDLPQALHDAAQFYWGLPQAWMESRPGLGADSTAVVIPRWRVQDIDEPQDWEHAEMMMRLMRDGDPS